MKKTDLKTQAYFLAISALTESSTITKLPPGKGFGIAEASWRTAVSDAKPDLVAQIRHAQLQGDHSWRLHVAEISDKVACHVHRDGIEVYEVISGAGTLYSGPTTSTGNNPTLLTRHQLAVKDGDVFIVPAGYAHQLVRSGDTPLIILFACPDSHLGHDRLVMPDIWQDQAKILVDSDALPGAARDILFRAAQRVKIRTIFIANKLLRMPDSEYISFELADQGFDEADARIVELAESGDIIVTADIPLAAAVVAKGALAVDPRGELYNEDNIKERLFVRDFMDNLRKSGATTGGPPPYGKKESKAFAGQIDRLLNKL